MLNFLKLYFKLRQKGCNYFAEGNFINWKEPRPNSIKSKSDVNLNDI